MRNLNSPFPNTTTTNPNTTNPSITNPMNNMFGNPTTSAFNTNQMNRMQPANLNYNASDQELKKVGFMINRNPSMMHSDTIQDMAFLTMGNNNYKLASTGWDKTLRLWNCMIEKNNSYMGGYGMHGKNDSPKAYCSISLAQKIDLKVYGLKIRHVKELNSLLVVCGDCTIKRVDLSNMQVTNLITLNVLALDVFFIQAINVMVVVTYDSKVHVYQTNNFQNPMKSIGLASTPCSADLSGNMLLIGMVDYHWSFVDVSLLGQQLNVLPVVKCALESPITKVIINRANNTIIATSCDGRIINSTFTVGMQNGLTAMVLPSDVNQCKKTFIFMGHGVPRSKSTGTKNPSDCYNITSLNINAQNKCFACTAGGDGNVIFWDLVSKSKIKSFNFKEGLTCGAISEDGMLGAFATGYDWSKGVWEMEKANQSISIGMFIFSSADLESNDKKK